MTDNVAEPEARLFIGNNGNGFSAAPDTIATLAKALDAIGRLNGKAFLVSDFADDSGVAKRFVVYAPGEEELSVLRAEYQTVDGAVDAELLQRVIQCAIHLNGWIVLDAKNEVVTDVVVGKQIKAMAIDLYRQEHL